MGFDPSIVGQVVRTSSTDKYYSLDSEDDFRSGCRNELLILLGSNPLLSYLFISSLHNDDIRTRANDCIAFVEF